VPLTFFRSGINPNTNNAAVIANPFCAFSKHEIRVYRNSSASVEINVIIDIGSADSGNELGLVIF